MVTPGLLAYQGVLLLAIAIASEPSFLAVIFHPDHRKTAVSSQKTTEMFIPEDFLTKLYKYTLNKVNNADAIVRTNTGHPSSGHA